MGVDYEQKARDNLIKFVEVVKRLIVGRKVKFDLVIGSGDSGAAMMRITEMVYQELKIPFPEKLLIPYQRFTKKDVPRGKKVNTVRCSDALERQLRGLRTVKNILFVDDEIGRGRTIRGIVNLIRENNSRVFSQDSKLWIVAEDHGFNADDLKLGLVVKFNPFSKKERINNAISYIVPYELKSVIRKIYSEKECNSKELMSILLNLPVKKLDEGMIIWDYIPRDKLAERIEGFDELQSKFEEFLRDLIRKSIEVHDN